MIENRAERHRERPERHLDEEVREHAVGDIVDEDVRVVRVHDPHGQPVRYGKPGYRQGGFVAWAVAPRVPPHAAAGVPV